MITTPETLRSNVFPFLCQLQKRTTHSFSLADGVELISPVAVVLSRLDYCNGCLCGLELRPLQLVQNTAARIVTLTNKREHIKPVLENLYWLPVKDRINHKILSLPYSCFRGTVPQYLQELIPCYLEPQSLRASSQSRLRILNVDEGHTQKQFGFRALFNQPPDWNALLKMLRESESSSAFCRKLKTHFFSNQ